MKSYPSYKDSGVPARRSHGAGGEWIGEIPNGWNIKRLKYFSTLITEKEDTNKDDIKISPENVESYTGNCFNLYSEYDGKGVPFKSGDILLNKLRLYLVKILLPDYYGFSMGEMIVIRINKNVLNKYYFYLLFNQGLIDLLDSQSTGIKVPRVSPEIIMATFLPYPPISVQQQIVSFLDIKTQMIDELIDKTEKKIELLKEKRTSLINHCVTKGLNPEVEMKDSGVPARQSNGAGGEWIGEIPELWDVKNLKYVMILSRGVDLPKEKFSDGIYPVYGSNGVIGYHNEYTTKGPCITVGRSGSVGEVNYVENDFWAHNTALYVLESYNNDIRFLYYLLLSIDLKSLSAGSAVGTLNRNYIHQEFVGYPLLSEQKEIACYLDDKTTQINSTIEKETQRIELLKEYRQSLISEVVTGKIDVRDWKK